MMAATQGAKNLAGASMEGDNGLTRIAQQMGIEPGVPTGQA